MISKISGGVKISVETFYQPEYSNPLNSEFMFAYKITIENNNDFPVKLLRRHWHIYDSDGSMREIIIVLNRDLVGKHELTVQRVAILRLIKSFNTYFYTT